MNDLFLPTVLPQHTHYFRRCQAAMSGLGDSWRFVPPNDSIHTNPLSMMLDVCVVSALLDNPRERVTLAISPIMGQIMYLPGLPSLILCQLSHSLPPPLPQLPYPTDVPCQYFIFTSLMEMQARKQHSA